tara:strand:+ start:517 stop:660 length:144 start_codon:yes stop_codon:yes gene_type:complete
MFRRSRAVGWNQYRIQKRYLGFIWLNYQNQIFTGYEKIALAVIRLNA